MATIARRDALQRRGCFGAQGYLFSRPRPADELIAWRGECELEPSWDI